MFLYNFCVAVYARLIALASLWNNKARLWTAGRKGIFERMAAAISPSDRIVWIHVASLGEFEQGRPVMERIKADYPQYKILLTFFSPSGYEVRKNYKGADYIFYMPIDTPRNVRRFLDLAHPEIAIFVKYEFWINYLTQLKRRNVRTFVISAIFRPNSIFFRRYGYLWRQALDSFEQIFVQNEESRRLLHDIGFDNVVVAGDTRFDRVAAIAEGVKRICLIERFKGDRRLFVAGSTWRPDEEILQPLINNNPEIKFVIVPHEMDECRINRIIAETTGGAVRYTQCDDSTPAGQCAGAGARYGRHALVGIPLRVVGLYRRRLRCRYTQYARGGHICPAHSIRSQLLEVQGGARHGGAGSCGQGGDGYRSRGLVCAAA